MDRRTFINSEIRNLAHAMAGKFKGETDFYNYIYRSDGYNNQFFWFLSTKVNSGDGINLLIEQEIKILTFVLNKIFPELKTNHKEVFLSIMNFDNIPFYFFSSLYWLKNNQMSFEEETDFVFMLLKKDKEEITTNF